MQGTRSGVVLAVSLALGACVSTAERPLARMPADAPVSAKSFLNDPAEFQFAVVGDRTGGHRPGVFARAMHQINWLRPEFVVSVGDHIEGYTEDVRELERQWSEVQRMVNDLEMPYFFVVGNHDVGNEVMRRAWRERLGREYYHFRYRDVLFIALSTEDPPTVRVKRDRSAELGIDPARYEAAISDAQVAYVREALAANSDVRWTMILMHKPAWKYDSPGFEQVEALLASRPYTVLAGHFHHYSRDQHRGRDYIQLGTTGGEQRQHAPGPGTLDHVMWVTMTAEGPVVANIALDGLYGLGGPASRPLSPPDGSQRPDVGR